jgi:flagellar FliJ protein
VILKVKRFKFGLEKVLKLRQHNEHEARVELGRAIGVLAGIENEIKRNAETRANAIHERFTGITADSADTASGGDENAARFDYRGSLSMHAWDAYINRLEQEADRLMEEAARAETVVEEKRSLYIEASRELKVMENLKERREKEHRKEMFVEETKELDDRKITINN